MVANLNDESQSWHMRPDGAYDRVDVSEISDPFCAHDYFMKHPSLSGRGSASEHDLPPQFAHVGARG